MSKPSVPERFEVLAEVASTDADVLLRAFDTILEREVFLKCPGPGLAAAYRDRDLAQTVLREARALARVHHPAVVGLIDVHETPDGPLLVLEPVMGETLAERLAREGPLEIAEVVELGIALAGALEAVHAAGIVHRGISPESVMLGTEGRTQLTGFHFAKPHAGSGLVSMASLAFVEVEQDRCPILPTHVAPEQIRGQRADARCDLFSLAWLLFESLTGEAPFEGNNPFDWKEPKDAGKLVPAAPRGLVRALSACLAPDATKRLKSASELRSALESSCEKSAPDDGSSAPSRASRRSAGLAAAAGAAVVAVAGVAYFVSDPFSATPLSAVPLSAVPLSAMDSNRGVSLADADDLLPGDLSNTYESSYALLIGIGDAYSGSGFPPLPNAEGDVEAIAEALARRRASGWQIETLLGEAATGDAVIDALAELSSKSQKNDRAFVFFAGHGIPHETSEESGWMIPADAERDKRSSWVRFDEFFRFFGESQAKHILVAMDCCYGGRLTTSRSAGPSSYNERYLTRKAHVVLTSGRGDEAVSDGTPGGHSPFSAAFLDALRGSEPLTSTMLFADIQRAFTKTEIGHTPQFGYPDGSPAGGEFVFFLED